MVVKLCGPTATNAHQSVPLTCTAWLTKHKSAFMVPGHGRGRSRGRVLCPLLVFPPARLRRPQLSQSYTWPTPKQVVDSVEVRALVRALALARDASVRRAPEPCRSQHSARRPRRSGAQAGAAAVRVLSTDANEVRNRLLRPASQHPRRTNCCPHGRLYEACCPASIRGKPAPNLDTNNHQASPSGSG